MNPGPETGPGLTQNGSSPQARLLPGMAEYPEIDLDPDELALLERHKPRLHFDPQYDYRLLAADSAVDNAGNLLRRRDGEVIARSGGEPPLSLQTLLDYPGNLEPHTDDCISMAPDYPGDARRMETEEAHKGRIYGRVAERPGGGKWLQYWFWLYYNPKNLFGFGKHEGDWEMIQVGLGADGEPEAAAYAQHDSGEARPWGEPDLDLVPGDPQRPLVYVAPLSHASYFKPGTHVYLLGIDHPFEDGPARELPVVPFGPWVYWLGKWGNTERTIARRIGGGPSSPAHQGVKWSDPEGWHRRMRYRRLRVAIGEVFHRLGKLTFPREPEVDVGRERGRPGERRLEIGRHRATRRIPPLHHPARAPFRDREPNRRGCRPRGHRIAADTAGEAAVISEGQRLQRASPAKRSRAEGRPSERRLSLTGGRGRGCPAARARTFARAAFRQRRASGPRLSAGGHRTSPTRPSRRGAGCRSPESVPG